jgi:asparagine synthase (glutamine-hydrolysing)
MCGICGVIYFNESRRVDEERLVNMMSLLARRGPDSSGYAVEGPAGFGHTRLSIIDLKTGDQPIFNEDKSKLIIFNGEIYNFKQIRDRLEAKGHVFSSVSDTEVILHLYEEKKERCVEELRGMFAFAIYDIKEKTLFAARDRLGQKPFYYYVDDEKFLFSSEIKSILKFDTDKELDLCAIKSYFANQFIEAPRTIYKNIRKLPAANTLMLKGRNIKIDRYWEMPLPAQDDRGFLYYKNRLVEELRESVRLRLISDVPLGAFLSGGIDSSIITALMKQEAKDEVKTFSIGFSEKSYDERSFSKEVASYFKTTHKEYEVNYDIADFLNNVLPYFDEPFGDGSSIGTHYLCNVTRQNVTVALSGDGGDELLAGYNRYLAGRFAKGYLKVPKFFRKRMIEIFVKMMPEGTGYYAKSLLKRLKLFIDFANRTETYPLKVLTTPFPPGELAALFSDGFKEQLKKEECRDYVEEISEKYSSLDKIEHMMYTDINTYLPEDILVKVDMMSMYNSLEVRAPFLDHKFVEFVSEIPLRYKLNVLNQKFILKEAFKDVLPGRIIKRKKQGFMTPISSWFKGELKDIARETLLKKGSASESGHSIFNEEYVEKLFFEHLNKKVDHGMKLWFIFVYKLAGI